MYNCLQSHELQHARLPCSSYFLEFVQTYIYWADDAIQPSHPLSSPSPAFKLAPYQGLYQWVSSFTSGGQIIGASASVLWMNIQGWFPLGLTGWISLPAKGLSRVLSRTTVWRHQFFGTQPFFIVQLSHLYMTTGQPIALTILTFVDNVMSLLLVPCLGLS